MGGSCFGVARRVDLAVFRVGGDRGLRLRKPVPRLPLPAYVGTLDVADLDAVDALGDPCPRYRGARLLLIRDGLPLGLVDLPLRRGRVDPGVLRRAAADACSAAPGADPVPRGTRTRTLSVAVCTRNRPQHLAPCLEQLRCHGYRQLLVVDNDPDDARTEEIVLAAERRDPRVRYVREPRRGVSAARNRALREASSDVIAFVDDDVRVSRPWLAALGAAFAESATPPACVTGPLFSAVLATPEQLACDLALGWSKGFRRRRFSLAEPSGSPIFPFSPGQFGFGANFAVDAAVARELGGFDEALGPGTRARAGEDIDFFVRLVLAGHVLAYEPSAYVWHHHRETAEQFRDQLVGYGMGLGAFLTKVALDPSMRRLAGRRLTAAVAHLAALDRHEAHAGVRCTDRALKAIAVLRGALAYAHDH